MMLDKNVNLTILHLRATFHNQGGRLVKSLERGGSVKDVWILDGQGNAVEHKKFIRVEDFSGNIITSFYRFPYKKDLKLKNVYIYVPEHKRGIINLPDKAFQVYGVNNDELMWRMCQNMG